MPPGGSRHACRVPNHFWRSVSCRGLLPGRTSAHLAAQGPGLLRAGAAVALRDGDGVFLDDLTRLTRRSLGVPVIPVEPEPRALLRALA